jgi:hypothetical protein
MKSVLLFLLAAVFLPPLSAAAQNASGGSTVYAYAAEDLNGAWNGQSATRIQFTENRADISGAGAAFSGTTLTISRAGTYVLSGELSGGQVLVNAGKNDTVRLVLNGLNLSARSGPAIYALQAAKTILTLAEGTVNGVTDTADYTFRAGEDEPDAAIFAHDSLTINGGGTLIVTGNFRDAVRSKDMLVITGGTLTVTAVKDALRGRDGVAILKGLFTLEAGEDGIQSNNGEDEAKGFVILESGTYTIRAGQDGIQAETNLTIAGGGYDIFTGGGVANARIRQEDFRGGGGRGDPRQGAPSAAVDSPSKKALKAGKTIIISDGVFRLDSEDDAVHSNGNLTVTGGDFTVKTGDDAFHADSALRIEGGKINITQCYEGLEGSTVDITGGAIVITAVDDAINAAGGNSETGMGPRGRDRFAGNSAYYVRISGGETEAVSGGDGIDANGNVFLEGGTIRLSGPSAGMQGAVDFDGRFLVTGGTLIAAGSIMPPAGESTQPVIMVSHDSVQRAGSVLALKDSTGNTLAEHTARTAFSASAFSAPEMRTGRSYSLYIDGKKITDITLNSRITAVSDSGGAYSLRNGGWGGGRR